MVSAGSPGDQLILRWESPGVIRMFSGGKGGASANLIGTDLVVRLEFPTVEFEISCTQRVLLRGFAEEREATSGSSQPCPPPPARASTIRWAGMVMEATCAAGGVSSKMVSSGAVVALVVPQTPLPL